MANFTVNNTNDSGAGSLREAIFNANGNFAADTIDTISFSIAPGSTIGLTTTGLPIIDSLVIDGDLDNNGTPDITVSSIGVVFNIDKSLNVAIDGLNITGGNSINGGGIINLGNLTLSNSTISGNSAGTSGGGIFNSLGTISISNSIISGNSDVSFGGIFNNSGIISISNSSISGNSAKVSGGGIYNNGGTVSISNSTISGNSAGTNGGGIYNKSGGIISIINSTLSGNSAGTNGGGIANGGSLGGATISISNSTLSGNSAGTGGGGIFNRDRGTASINNTIIAQNVNNSDIGPNGVFSGSNNLIGNGNGKFTNGVNGNIVGTVDNPIDAKLAPLANNGGFTKTQGLLAGSPAINAGSNPNNLTTDQRGAGFPRVKDGTIDIGAFEVQSTSLPTPLLNTPIYRFQNSNRPGTYLFAGEEERNNINGNFPNFREEGQAFTVGVEPGDDLIPMYRFQNSGLPGTYLYAGEAESQSIRQNFTNFIEEGIAFYVYPGDANKGIDFYRFQNSQQPGTYLFVGEQERQNILANFPNFIQEGVAFEVGG